MKLYSRSDSRITENLGLYLHQTSVLPSSNGLITCSFSFLTSVQYQHIPTRNIACWHMQTYGKNANDSAYLIHDLLPIKKASWLQIMDKKNQWLLAGTHIVSRSDWFESKHKAHLQFMWSANILLFSAAPQAQLFTTLPTWQTVSKHRLYYCPQFCKLVLKTTWSPLPLHLTWDNS